MKRISRLFAAGVSAAVLMSGTSAQAQEGVTKSPDIRGEVSGSIGRGLYSKPVWRRAGKGAYVGGYIDFNYKKEQGSAGRFDQHRLIPFIYADIAEGLRFATEIELEHGGPQNNQKDGDAKVEFAVLDYELWGEKLAARGGIILAPLGKLNLAHDSPLQDLTERPLVDQFLIPTTLSESGAGVFGTFYPTEFQKLDYEVYMVNGFNGDSSVTSVTASTTTGVLTAKTTRTPGGNITTGGLRGARGGQKSDNNNNKAVVGRVGYSPRLGYELGVSGHRGIYDDAGENNLTIMAADAAAQFGPLEVLGELAQASVDRGTGVSQTSVPGRLGGYYVQANMHFLQDVLRQGSTFTGVIRYDRYDTDLSEKATRITYGLNFRPVEDAVFILNYQANDETPTKDNDAVLLSLASYF